MSIVRPKLRGVRVETARSRYVYGVIYGAVIFGVVGYAFAFVLGFVHDDDTNVASRVCDRFPAGSSYESAIAYARDVVNRPARIEEHRAGFRVIADYPDPSKRPMCEIVAARGEVTGARYWRGRNY